MLMGQEKFLLKVACKFVELWLSCMFLSILCFSEISDRVCLLSICVGYSNYRLRNTFVQGCGAFDLVASRCVLERVGE